MVKMDPDIRNHYDRHYRSGESEWRRLGALDKARHIQEMCAGHEYHSVLEIGAGEGALLQRLGEVGFGSDLAALEVSEAAVSVVKARKIPNLSTAVLFDGYNAPFSDGRFDLAILSHVLEHVEHPRALLLEARRVARKVFIEVPLELRIRTPRDFVPTSTGHINLFNPTVIRHLIQTTGMTVAAERVFNPGYPVYRYLRGTTALPHYLLKEILLRTAPFLAVRLFTYHWCGLCGV